MSHEQTITKPRTPRTVTKSHSRRYVVNHRLLILTLGVLALTLPAAYFWYQHQLQSTANALLARAEELQEEGDWSEATTYYQRYLLLQPDDTEALVKLVEAVAQGEPSADRLARFNNLLYRAIGRAPDRHDLHRMLAENLLKLGAFAEAETEAKWLIENAPQEAGVAQKVLALSIAARSSSDRSNSQAEAVSALLLASAELPGDPQLIEVAASMLRDHPAAVELAEGNAATAADQLMDRLVATDPNNVLARLARYRYRLRYKLADPESDLKAALELEPNNSDAILLYALSKTSGSPTEEDLADAESHLRRAIEQAPKDPRAYVVLASILEKTERFDEALALLESGCAATNDNFNMALVLASMQIGAGELDAAKQSLRKLQSQASDFMVRLDSDTRTDVENRLRLLNARMDMAQGNSRLAIPRLQETLLALEVRAGYQSSREWLEATRQLAEIYSSFGQWDKASEYWGALAKAMPADSFAVGRAADAYLKAANAELAIAVIDDFARLTKPNADLLVQLVQAHLAQQLSRLVADRNWTEFQKALETAKLNAGDRIGLTFAEVQYLAANEETRQHAAAFLRAAETTFGGDSQFWRTAATTYQELGRQQDAQRALDQFRQLAPPAASDPALLEATLLANAGKYKEADQLLANIDAPLNPEGLKVVGRLRVKILAAGDDFDGALQQVRRLIEDDPRDADALAMGIEIALTTGDLSAAEKWESQLRELTNDGPEANYWRARRFFASYEKLQPHDKVELERAIQELRMARPRWHPAVALAAQNALLQGDSRQALADYRLAVELGDHRPTTLQQVVTLLYQFGRFKEAEKYLSMATVGPKPQSFFDVMAVELAAQQGLTTAAVTLARQSVERSPQDVTRRIVLAQMLLRQGKPLEGVEVLRTAAREFRNDSRVWLGLLAALAESGETEDARKTLAALVKSSVLPENQRYLVAAQGYDILGDTEEAKKHYKLAIAQTPNDIALRLRYAKLLSASDARAARSQYERVLQQDSANSQARRELAVLLAATRQRDDWSRATALLASAAGETTGDAQTNDRLRAMLLAQTGRTRGERIANCQTARDILTQLNEAGAPAARDLNGRLIAQILEQEAEQSGDGSLLLEARDQLRTVVQRGPPNAEELSTYIEFLLRHATAPTDGSAGRSESDDADSELHERSQGFLSEAETQLGEFKRLPPGGSDRLQVMADTFQVRLLHAQGRTEEAMNYVSDVVGRQPSEQLDRNKQAQRHLQIAKLYSSIDAHAEAEKWYRRLMEFTPNAYVLVVRSLEAQGKHQEAIKFCLTISDGKPSPEMAAVLASVMTNTDEPADVLSEVETAIESALETHNKDIQLLQAEAVRRASRGEYEEAVAIFRRILTIDPDNVLTLNNLATLLAEDPNQRAEALEHIVRAIEIAGRQASLLDTQGTILLKAGQIEQAIACLEEATAGGAADARYYLHLAAAYQQVHRNDDARRMLDESRAFGLEKFVLTRDDRELLNILDEKLALLVPAAAGQ